MSDIFMIYWGIGVVLVLIREIVSLLYIKSQGDNYVYEPNTAPAPFVILSSMILTVVYPIYIIILMISVMRYRQRELQMVKLTQEIVKKVEIIKKRWEEERHE